MTAISRQAALITPRGRGAVATWWIRGDVESWQRLPFESAISLTPVDQPLGRILFGQWRGEKVVLAKTGEFEWELHSHGGAAAVNRLQTDLEEAGFQIISWQQSLTEKTTRLESEFLIATTQTVTWKTTEILLRHSADHFLQRLRTWKQKLASPSPELEEVISECDEILRWETLGQRLTQPTRVVLAGVPNAGKSSLLNRLAGYERTIVQNQPGTTRDVIGVEIALDGFPVTLTDTAGLRMTEDRLESLGISKAREVLKKADLIVHLIDLTSEPIDEERQFDAQFPNAITVLHKCDATAHATRQPTSDLRVSSLTGEGLDQLIEAIVRRLFSESPDEQQIIPVTDRQCRLLATIQDSLRENDPARAIHGIETLIHGEQHPTSQSAR
ncbi:MAG: 50S ribosome-binding GTPase [Planctomycetaceae bacterium]|nr:50S ribosome-binding GTPase [Planctomycetaceae bacterium]